MHKYFATTVALITSCADDHPPNVMACEWTMNISYHPLRVISVIDRRDLTYELITASGEFGVNLCSEQQAALSSYAGNVSGRNGSKLAAPVFAGQTYSAKRIQVPMISGCVLNLECVVEQTVELGDHTGFVGRVVAARINRRLRPLLYHQGKYFQLSETLTKPGQ